MSKTRQAEHGCGEARRSDAKSSEVRFGCDKAGKVEPELDRRRKVERGQGRRCEAGPG